ncbi:MAG: hypothetical protein ACLQGP_32950, partial [Isosphaeraceae bacterium]
SVVSGAENTSRGELGSKMKISRAAHLYARTIARITGEPMTMGETIHTASMSGVPHWYLADSLAPSRRIAKATAMNAITRFGS